MGKQQTKINKNKDFVKQNNSKIIGTPRPVTKVFPFEEGETRSTYCLKLELDLFLLFVENFRKLIRIYVLSEKKVADQRHILSKCIKMLSVL